MRVWRASGLARRFRRAKAQIPAATAAEPALLTDRRAAPAAPIDTERTDTERADTDRADRGSA